MARNGTHFSESHFEKKLNNLKDTQESIQGLSTWCLNHKSDLNHIIKCWLKAIKKSKPEQCLTLFYLANDVIQHSKKKSLLDLVSAWEFALKEATPYARYFITFNNGCVIVEQIISLLDHYVILVILSLILFTSEKRKYEIVCYVFSKYGKKEMSTVTLL